MLLPLSIVAVELNDLPCGTIFEKLFYVFNQLTLSNAPLGPNVPQSMLLPLHIVAAELNDLPCGTIFKKLFHLFNQLALSSAPLGPNVP